MKHVVKVICLMLSVVLTAGALLCGCGKKENLGAPNRYVDYDLTKYVKLGQYKGVEVENYPYELTDESVQQQIQIALSNYAFIRNIILPNSG